MSRFGRCRANISGTISRLHEQAAFTMVEAMVAMLLLLGGMLATFLLISGANATMGKTHAREGATNLGRELLEDAHDTPYAQVGQTGWFQQALQNVPGGSGVATASGGSYQTTVMRRGVRYVADVTWCALDDPGDGYGVHAAGVAWCSDSTGSGTQDPQPEDFKRVTAALSWSVGRTAQPPTQQTTTFASTGAAVGPSVSDLSITSPNVANPAAPVITSTPSGGIVSFLATSSGASDMKFSVNGSDQLSGVTNNNNGSWSLNWNISQLPDGVYTVGATAVDALGERGQQRSLQVRLARGAPAPPANVTGGYNYVNVSGTRTLAVELAWDANIENVTGYEVLRGSTVVCSGSVANSCIDLSPAASGSTIYTVRALYTDASGAQGYAATTYSVTAPTSVSTLYGFTNGTTATGGCTPGATNGDLTDLVTTFPTSGGTTSTNNLHPKTITGCMPLLPAGVSMNAGTATFTGRFVNTGSKSCLVNYSLLLNNSTAIAGSSFSGSTSLTIPSGVTAPTSYTATFATGARSFNSGDRLSFWLASGSNGDCAGTTLYFGSGANQSTLFLPLTSPGSLAQPGVPSGLAAASGSGSSTVLTWTAPTGTPAPEFYRIYRDGQNYTSRIDTAGATGTNLTWTDTNTGGVAHTYWVTAASPTLAESNFAGPVTR